MANGHYLFRGSKSNLGQRKLFSWPKVRPNALKIIFVAIGKTQIGISISRPFFEPIRHELGIRGRKVRINMRILCMEHLLKVLSRTLGVFCQLT